jgi:hypothetical protein
VLSCILSWTLQGVAASLIYLLSHRHCISYCIVLFAMTINPGSFVSRPGMAASTHVIFRPYYSFISSARKRRRSAVSLGKAGLTAPRVSFAAACCKVRNSSTPCRWPITLHRGPGRRRGLLQPLLLIQVDNSLAHYLAMSSEILTTQSWWIFASEFQTVC